jgi:ankyrin repeat protein
LLLDWNANINHADNEGVTPFGWASTNGQEAVVLLLLDQKAYVNQANNYEETPLHHASAHITKLDSN